MNPIKLFNGYKVRECKECKRDINLNSMVPNDDICLTCLEDTTVVKIYEVTTGDYNDVYNRMIVKGTGKQIEKYVKQHFSSTKGLEDLGSDSIGYCRRYKNGDLKLYVEAVELDIGYIDYSIDRDLSIINGE